MLSNLRLLVIEHTADRNLQMAARVQDAPVRYPFRFAFAGDSGAWSDPTGDAIFSSLVAQVGALDPPPIFFANVGDFAGPGTVDRHEHYLRLVAPLQIPNICVVGNHDLDDPSGAEAFKRVHGPSNFDFAYGHTRFVAIDAAPGLPGEVDIGVPPEGTEGPREEALRYLDAALDAAPEEHRVVLMHMPPNLAGHYAPHEEWGFRRREQEFFEILHRHRVKLVCCAHGLHFDEHVHEGVRFVMSGGGGTGLCSHWRGVCAAGEGTPENRGALFHATEVSIDERGRVSGRVLQAFADQDAASPYAFSDASSGASS
jgi:Calcineurin-like phosphoesterase